MVTSDFHVMRTVGIAKNAGYQNVEGLAAKSVGYLIQVIMCESLWQ